MAVDFNYLGVVATDGDLPTSGTDGDYYLVATTGISHAWVISNWQPISSMDSIQFGSAGPSAGTAFIVTRGFHTH